MIKRIAKMTIGLILALVVIAAAFLAAIYFFMLAPSDEHHIPERYEIFTSKAAQREFGDDLLIAGFDAHGRKTYNESYILSYEGHYTSGDRSNWTLLEYKADFGVVNGTRRLELSPSRPHITAPALMQTTVNGVAVAYHVKQGNYPDLPTVLTVYFEHNGFSCVYTADFSFPASKAYEEGGAAAAEEYLARAWADFELLTQDMA